MVIRVGNRLAKKNSGILIRPRLGNGVSLDGVNDRIEFPASNDFKINAVDVEMTLKINSNAPTVGNLLAVYNDRTDNRSDAYGIAYNSSRQLIMTATNSSLNIKLDPKSANNCFSIGELFKIKSEWRSASNGNYMRMYKNGDLVIDRSLYFEMDFNGSRLTNTIGAYINTSPIYLSNCTIYECKITNKNTDTVILHYDFNQTNPSRTLPDLSGRGNTGELLNVPSGVNPWVDYKGEPAI